MLDGSIIVQSKYEQLETGMVEFSGQKSVKMISFVWCALYN